MNAKKEFLPPDSTPFRHREDRSRGAATNKNNELKQQQNGI
jgi:hypothetical protein